MSIVEEMQQLQKEFDKEVEELNKKIELLVNKR